MNGETPKRKKSRAAERPREEKAARPTRRLEFALAQRAGGGGALVAGVDEAGRGPLAGPVVAAAVIWPARRPTPRGVDDSKRLDPARRRALFPEICAGAQAAAVGLATAREIDAINILEATRLAARRALAALRPAPGAVITDALAIEGLDIPVEPVVRGDRRCMVIAAASILAKEFRDAILDLLDAQYPGYGWGSNRGYPTPDHYRAIEALGPTTQHRLTFRGVGFFPARLRASRCFIEALRAPAAGISMQGLEREPPRAWILKRENGDMAPPALSGPFRESDGAAKDFLDSLRNAPPREFLDERERESLLVRAAHPAAWSPPSWFEPE